MDVQTEILLANIYCISVDERGQKKTAHHYTFRANILDRQIESDAPSNNIGIRKSSNSLKENEEKKTLTSSGNKVVVQEPVRVVEQQEEDDDDSEDDGNFDPELHREEETDEGEQTDENEQEETADHKEVLTEEKKGPNTKKQRITDDTSNQTSEPIGSDAVSDEDEFMDYADEEGPLDDEYGLDQDEKEEEADDDPSFEATDEQIMEEERETVIGAMADERKSRVDPRKYVV